jgi:hypothetical protein
VTVAVDFMPISSGMLFSEGVADAPTSRRSLFLTGMRKCFPLNTMLIHVSDHVGRLELCRVSPADPDCHSVVPVFPLQQRACCEAELFCPYRIFVFQTEWRAAFSSSCLSWLAWPRDDYQRLVDRSCYERNLAGPRRRRAQIAHTQS